MLTNRGSDHRLFDAIQLTAYQHRENAKDYAEKGNWATVIQSRLHGVACKFEEDVVLNTAPLQHHELAGPRRRYRFNSPCIRIILRTKQISTTSPTTTDLELKPPTK